MGYVGSDRVAGRRFVNCHCRLGLSFRTSSHGVFGDWELKEQCEVDAEAAVEGRLAECRHINGP